MDLFYTMKSMTKKLRPAPTPTPLGIEVKRRRDDAGVTQEWLAERCGVTREAISAIETGDTKRPGNKILSCLQQYLGLRREDAYILMAGAHPPETDEDLKILIVRLGKLPDQAARLKVLTQLPQEVQDSILILASDLLQAKAQQLREALQPGAAEPA